MADLERLENAYKKLGSPKTYFTKKMCVDISREKFIKEAADMTEYLVKLKESGKDILFNEKGEKIISKVKA